MQKSKTFTDKFVRKRTSRRRASGAERFPRHCKPYTEDTVDTESHQGMKDAWKTDSSSFMHDSNCAGANLSVLRRMLFNSVNRKWSDVYREICKQLRKKYDRHHVDRWIYYEVSECVLMDNEPRTYYGGKVYGFYIHPETGLLQYIKPRHRKGLLREGKRDLHRVIEVDGTLYHQHKGLWYRVKMREYESPRWDWSSSREFSEYPDLTQDPLFTGNVPFPQSVKYILIRKYGLSPNKKAWMCIEKQSANSREIKKIKEVNKQ